MKFICAMLFVIANVGFASQAHAKPSSPKSAGTYTFKSSSGKPYIGKSNDMDRRLKEHERSGKLKAADRDSIKKEPSQLSNKGVSTVERTRIRAADIYTNGGLENKQNAPLSRARKK